MEKVLSESIIQEMTQEIISEVEAGFDDYSGATATVTPDLQGATYTADIAQQAPKIAIAKTAISLSLPAMIGFNQPMKGPAGFVFGLVQREETKVTHTGIPLVPVDAEDQIITRKLVETGIRVVKLKMTQEAMTDIQRLFGNDFNDHYKAFQKSGGEIWQGPNKDIAKFMLDVGMRRMADKINYDFVEWIQKTATIKGKAVLATYAESTNIYGIIGELREALFKATGKSGKPCILVSPRIAAFISSTLGSTLATGATSFEVGRTIPQDRINGYVLTMGDIDVYQYDFSKIPLPKGIEPKVTGGMVPQTHSEDKGYIYLGYQGLNADSASVYYMPYSEYLVQSEDYETGQPTIWYKVRDAWTTNPLDTYDDTQPTAGLVPPAPADNTSSFLMGAEVEFSEVLIQPI